MSPRMSASAAFETRASGYLQPQQATPPPSSVWIDPALLENCGQDAQSIGGNASLQIKQLTGNTYTSYGLGDEECFGHAMGEGVKFVDVSVDRNHERVGRMEATTVAEVTVSKNMLNGAGMLHGGCVATLIDNCCSTPLVVLGLAKGLNGVGVTQSMSILFHSPAPLGTTLQIISTSLTLGGRVGTSRCEIVDKTSGRVIASAHLSKMQPIMAKL